MADFAFVAANSLLPCPACCGTRGCCQQAADGSVVICRVQGVDPQGRPGSSRFDVNGRLYWVWKRD